ncbi:MAG: ergothioneine biosynthesis protein EgtC [Gammaproteobacteria bacterium]|nr:ergothioneine biosynthesis protein EgtC [Gammaproteobacteria bacterium]NIR98042.1 ergothioneine biosynthesis protein EgtC [Gammaproteobacteria bacterium]NIT63749.1 ergothioneine biosynthesis protein EgtC [Gammaproteobacteria bacterium]NIV19924.1 ergothioneine biosynthesis protein EgtC [Gammaproteobacteria bacterium]NIX11413.1 ergothioneine biosynthesis protein EgtC [Gammaproteobacteria bacterium]
MCRMAAYLGPPIRLDQFLLRPPHNLVEQSHNPRELNYARLNADGYGIGWYPADGLPAAYVNPMPIWSEPNLPHLARSLTSDLWVANIRSATPGFPVDYSNTQPFHDDTLLFMHNGFVRGFRSQLRPILQGFLNPGVHAEIRGCTDSEFLFALLRHALSEESLSLEEAIGFVFDRLEDWAPETPAMLNLVVSSGQTLYAARHAMNEACPSLYYTVDDEAFPGGQLVASERLTDAEYWSAVPEHSILILGPEQPPELHSL